MTKRNWRYVGRVAGVVMLLACSNGSTPPNDAGTNDGAQTDGPSGDGSGDAGGVACNGMFPEPAVTQMQIASNPPAATGGSVTDGVYYLLIALNTYTGPGGASGPTNRSLMEEFETVMSAVPPHWQYVTSSDGGPVEHETATVSFAGVNVTQQFSCPTISTITQGYSATGTDLRLYAPNGSATDELVFKQQ